MDRRGRRAVGKPSRIPSAVLTLSALAFASPATAAVFSPGYAYSGGFDTVSPVASTVGFWFYVTQDITATELGFVDVGSDGLDAPAAVGLWSDGGTLLSSATVPTGTAVPLIGGFRYTPILPVPLFADNRYWVGGQVAGQTYVNGVSQTSAPQLIVVDAGYTYATNGTGLNFPNGFIQGGSAAVSNFLFVTPEPASLTLVAMGGIGLVRRRRN